MPVSRPLEAAPSPVVEVHREDVGRRHEPREKCTSGLHADARTDLRGAGRRLYVQAGLFCMCEEL